MTDRRDKWFKSMYKRLGVSTEDEVRAFMRMSAAKTKGNTKNAYFKVLKEADPAKFKEISAKGGKTTWEAK